MINTDTTDVAAVFEVTVPLSSDQDVVGLRRQVRELAVAHGFSLIDQTKFVTAGSELARNTLLHGGGGQASIQVVHRGARVGLRVVFTDRGGGIVDIERALQDGYSTGGGLGLGLGGSRRLCDEFEIASTPGQGTTIAITKWKPY